MKGEIRSKRKAKGRKGRDARDAQTLTPRAGARKEKRKDEGRKEKRKDEGRKRREGVCA